MLGYILLLETRLLKKVVFYHKILIILDAIDPYHEFGTLKSWIILAGGNT